MHKKEEDTMGIRKRRKSTRNKIVIKDQNTGASTNGEGVEVQNCENEIQINNDKYKIDPDKILKVNEQLDFTNTYEHAEIACIHCEEKSIEGLLEKFNISKFPKLFVFQFTFEVLSEEIIKKLYKVAEVKLSNFAPFVVQFVDEKLSRISNYIWRFQYLYPLDLSSEIQENKLTIENFFTSQTCVLSESNYQKVLDLYKLQIQEYEPFLHAINAGEKLCYRILKLFKLNFDNNAQNKILRLVIKSRDFELLKLYYGISSETDISNEQISKYLGQENNLFLLAVEERNEEIVKFILKSQKLSRSESFNLSLIGKAIELCIEKDNFEIYFMIIEQLSVLSEVQKNGIQKVITKAEDVVKIIDELFQNVQKNNIEEVKKFIEDPNYFNYRICYNIINKEKLYLLEWALKCEKFEIFALLKNNGFYIDKPDKLNLMLSRLKPEHKAIIRDENEKYMKKDPCAFLLTLQEKIEYDALSPVYAGEVREMLENLKDINDIRPFLQITSKSSVKIYFDYKEESVQSMNPCASDTTFGIADHTKNKIYVAKCITKEDQWGTFVHELAHYVFYLIYDNNCLPYCEHDNEREQEFDNARKETLKTKNAIKTDEIIKVVFDYRKANQKLIELAVRVPHLAAKYHTNPKKLNKISTDFTQIFDYHRTKVLKDFAIPNLYQLIKLNNDFGIIKSIKKHKLKMLASNSTELLNLTQKRIILHSNVPQLTLSKLYNEIDKNTSNKLKIKTENIFIDFEKLNQDAIREELKELLKSSDIRRIIFVAESLNDENISLLKEYMGTAQIFIIIEHRIDLNFQDLCTGLSVNENDLLIFEQEHSWSEITKESQNFLKSKRIKFHEKKFKILKIIKKFNYISNKSFAMLCLNDNIHISCAPKIQTKKLEFFYERLIEDNGNKLKVEEFVSHIQSNRVVLISDVAGSGKTTYLKKVREVLIENFKKFWISFVPLQKVLDKIFAGIGDSFRDFIADALELNPLERDIFNEKFSKGEVRILFDGFDEISPRITKETLELFKKFLDDSNGNQIWITTRTHHEENLEKVLNKKAFKLKTLEPKEQNEFLKVIWNDPSKDEYAKSLIEKVEEIFSFKKDVIGIPLIIEGLANYYKNKTIKELEKEIKRLKFFTVFEKIVIDLKFEILGRRYKDKLLPLAKIEDSPLKILQCLAIQHFFEDYQFYNEDFDLKTFDSERFASLLGFKYDKNAISSEEISRTGIVLYDNDWSQQKFFVHEVYAEFFLAKAVYYILRFEQNPSIAQKDFFIEILQNEKFEVVQTFLRDLFSEYEDSILEKIAEQRNIVAIYEKLKPKLHGQASIRTLIEIFKNHMYYSSLQLRKDKTILEELFPQLDEYFSQTMRDICRSSENYLNHINNSSLDYLKLLLKILKDEIILDSNGIKFEQKVYKFISRIKQFHCDRDQQVILNRIFCIKDFHRIFYAICSQNDVKVLKILTKDSESIVKVLNFSDWSRAQQIVRLNRYHEVSYTLHSFENKYYDKYNIGQYKFDLDNFYENIKNGEIEKVKKFTEIHPNLKVCYNSQGQSALETSLEHSRIEIYNLLMFKGFITYKNLQTITLNLEAKQQKQVRYINEKFLGKNFQNTNYDLIYENNGLPYFKHDFEREEKWQRVLDETKIIFHKNLGYKFESIKVFSKILIHNALKQITFNLKYPYKLREVRESFPELFKYLEDFVIPDLKIQNIMELNNKSGIIGEFLNCKVELRVRKEFDFLNSDIKLLILTSNAPHFTFYELFHEIKNICSDKLNLKTQNIFLNSDQLQNSNTRKDLQDLNQNYFVKRIIVELKDVNEECLKFLDQFNDTQIIFIMNEELFSQTHIPDSYKIVKCSHGWHDLKKESKNNIQSRIVNFQGCSMPISELIDVNKTKNEIFQYLCFQSTININLKTDFMKVLKIFTPQSDLQIKVKKIQRITLSVFDAFPKTYWVSFVEEINIFIENFIEKIIKIFDFNSLEAYIFKDKFRKGEVRFLVKSLDAKELSLEIQENFNRTSRKYCDIYGDIKCLNNRLFFTQNNSNSNSTEPYYLEDSSNFNKKIKYFKEISENVDEFHSRLKKVQKFYGQNFLGSFLFRPYLNSTAFEYLAEHFRNEVFEAIILSQNSKGETILHQIFQNFERLKKIFDLIEIKTCKEFQKEVFKFQDRSGGNLLHFFARDVKGIETFKQICLKIPETFKKREERFDKKDQNILQFYMVNERKEDTSLLSFELDKKILSIKKLLLNLNQADYDSLCLATQCKTKDELEFLFGKIFQLFFEKEIKDILNPFGYRRKTLSTLIESDNIDSNLIKFLVTIYDEVNGEFSDIKNEFFGLHVDLKNYINIKDHKGNSILQALALKNNIQLFIFVFENIICKFTNLKEFIHECDEDSKNILHFLASFGSVSFLKFVFEKIESTFETREIKEILRMKIKGSKRNLLHAGLKNKDENSIQFILEKLKEFLEKDDLKKMFHEPDKFDCFPIHYAIEFSITEIFELFAKLYKENFTKEEIEKLSKIKNFLCVARRNETEKNMEDTVKKCFECYYIAEIKDEINKGTLESTTQENNITGIGSFLQHILFQMSENISQYISKPYKRSFRLVKSSRINKTSSRRLKKNRIVSERFKKRMSAFQRPKKRSQK